MGSTYGVWWRRRLTPLLLLASCGLLPPDKADVTIAHRPLACQALPGIVGAEDITIDQRTGLAYLSSADRRAVLNGALPSAPDGTVGKIYRMDVRATPPIVWDVTPEGLSEKGFYPHGISLFTRRDGSTRLFVINHHAHRDRAGLRWAASSGDETVELFDIAASDSGPDLLRQTEPSIRGAGLISPNDLTAVGERQFYVTNEHGVGPGINRTIRDLIGANNGDVQYFDGSRFQQVLTLPWANGIQADLAAHRLYVASAARGTITTLAWTNAHPASPLPDVRPLPTGTGVDNIELMPGHTGELLVAAHPAPLRLIAFAYQIAASAPTQILTVTREGVTEILRVEGNETAADQIAAASVAAAWTNPKTGRQRLVIGSIFSNRVLICDPAN